MISTTLMTFLLTTNPDVRSVHLLGSWDNFSKPYAMERDKRVGPGHWRGCHTFTDIMADAPNDTAQWRSGGLKMGATYWYYYLLNDDVEFYSEVEPVTTKCPLLPGQPVNVLNVPIILPDSRPHSRSNSHGSEKFEHRTMNPEDKYMNPRKPPKPDLARLQTSGPRHKPSPSYPLSTSPIGKMIHRSASQPNSALRRKYQAKDARSVSPPCTRGVQPPFPLPNEGPSQKRHQETPHSKVPREEKTLEERRNIPGIRVNATGLSPSPSKHRAKPPPSTIQSRRALKANGHDPAHALGHLTVKTRPQPRKPDIAPGAANSELSAADEMRAIKEALALSAEANSSDMATPRGPDSSEKRLPSLPNTPSSVMDEAVRSLDEVDQAMNDQVPRSHFSSMTADESTNSRVVPERSRFSEWSTDTETEDHTPASMVSTSTFNHPIAESPAVDDWRTPDLSQPNDAATNTDPNTPHLTVHSKPSSPNSASGDIPPWNPPLPEFTVSLAPDMEGSGLGIEPADEVESNPKRHAALFSALQSMEQLSLSQSSNDSPILLPELQRGSSNETPTSDGRTPSRRSDASFRGKATMQEMMDELSYLKNMIQAEMDGEPF
ncbi:hypothetical protein N7492_007304 [Penicillium capsulatum]|uniref:Uncharacterized protein n=1 Tax=Penicillium capsulatum TaxID=69766 RepID=A0A9W9LKP2_9EURO|nr:hypothetical protein N7492_007304 [Penicillium capsulatum]KAJ6117144.1 hypothetical protein N7512_006869 [Penicillium capsulatum]